MTNVFLPRTNHAGDPWLSRSVASGRARHNFRNASSCSIRQGYDVTLREGLLMLRDIR